MLYIYFFSCVLTLSRLFPTTFKPGQICNLIRRFNSLNSLFPFCRRQWRHIRVVPGFRSYCHSNQSPLIVTKATDVDNCVVRNVYLHAVVVSFKHYGP